MEKFTHGIMVVIPSQADEHAVPVVHFVGYWEEPQKSDVVGLMHELETNEEFNLVAEANVGLLEYYPATPEILEHYNSVVDNEKEEA